MQYLLEKEEFDNLIDKKKYNNKMERGGNRRTM